MLTPRTLLWTTTLLAVTTLYACGSKGSPTEPSGPPSGSPQPSPPPPPALTVPVTPVRPAIASIDIPARTATLSFRAVPNSPQYVIEIGTFPGATNATTLTIDEGTGPGGTFTRTFTDLPPGFLYARVKAQNQAGTSVESAELKFLLQDMKYVTETLFFQTGPYGGEAPHNVVRGFRRGSRVTIRVSSSVTAAQRLGIDNVLAQLGELGAPVTASVTTMRTNRALCVRNEIHVVTVDNACGTGVGCINTCAPATLSTPWETASIFLGPAGQGGDNADVAAHELGHALLGLYHFGYLGIPERPSHPAFFGTPEFPHVLMFWQVTTGQTVHNRLSNLEVKALQAAYRAGISAGSTRGDMRARGLIY